MRGFVGCVTCRRELHLALERKEMELQSREQKIQDLQNQIVVSPCPIYV